MKNIFISLVVLFFISLLISCQAWSCSFDTDCEVGSKCVKKGGSIYGVCVGGLSPGNDNDKVPVYAPLDINKTYGNTCSFDTDCGPGSECVKSNGGINGTCMKNNYNTTPYQQQQPVYNDGSNCKGYAGPGGPCYAGPGGAAYDGPGGPAYAGPGGPKYSGPGGPEYAGPGGGAYAGPGGPRYSGPGGAAYDGPGGPAYAGPGGPCYDGPGGPCYSGPGGMARNCPSVCQ